MPDQSSNEPETKFLDFSQTVELGPKTTRILKRIALAIEALVPPAPVPQPKLNILGGDFMFVLPDDQPDVPFTVSPISAADAEGNAVKLTEQLSTSDANVIDFIYDPDSSGSNPRSGKAHIGAPGTASVTYTASDPQGNIVKSGGAQFTITTGAIGAVTGGDLTFEGITETPPTPPTPPTP